MDWILSALVVLTNILIGKKNKWGWIIGSITSFLWIVYALFILNPAQYGLVPSAILNLIISILSSIKWFKEDRKKSEKNCIY
jgi:hypothetical protein